MTLKNIKNNLLVLCVVAFFVGIMPFTGNSLTPFQFSKAVAQENGYVPGGVKDNQGSPEYWRAVRQGVQGNVSIPDKKAGVLVQSSGDDFRLFHDDGLKPIAAYYLGAMVLILILFYAIRGKITIESGSSGRTVIRFSEIERIGHWLMASSFVLLAITGLNTLYGKTLLMPILGDSAFASLTYYTKISHNFIGFAFMAGLILTIVLWIRHNFPTKEDIQWMLAAGGLFSKHSHPPARKFNAGQKILFWAVSIGGISISFTGICLMIPFEFAPFSGTFAILNAIGFDLPTNLSAVQEGQLSLLWHGVASLVLVGLIIAHIYIGSIGMEGAFDAISSGEVDENWAREHHSLWLEELTDDRSKQSGD